MLYAEIAEGRFSLGCEVLVLARAAEGLDLAELLVFGGNRRILDLLVGRVDLLNETLVLGITRQVVFLVVQLLP